MQPAIRIRDLRKSYGGRPVVDGLSLDVAPATVCALLGANGAGKTTTVECVEGFRRPDAGEVRVLGLDPRTDRDTLVARVGVMLQEGGAYPAATPAEMLRLYARFYPAALDPAELLARVGLADVAAVRHRALSGGQKQRLNLALALVGRPRVAILDEPTAGLDPVARRRTWDLLAGLRDEGATVLLTTHLLDDVERLADTVAVLHRGRLLALDSPAGLVSGHAGRHLVVTTPAATGEVTALAAAVGARVEAREPGRYVVHAGPEAMAAVTAWFADRRLPLTAVTSSGGSLEDVYLDLTGQEAPR